MLQVSGLVGPLLALAASGCVYRAYLVHEQFLPTCIYLIKSNFNMLVRQTRGDWDAAHQDVVYRHRSQVLMSFCLYCLYLTARLAGKLLFGPLRLIESEVGIA